MTNLSLTLLIPLSTTLFQLPSVSGSTRWTCWTSPFKGLPSLLLDSTAWLGLSLCACSSMEDFGRPTGEITIGIATLHGLAELRTVERDCSRSRSLLAHALRLIYLSYADAPDYRKPTQYAKLEYR
ncbi:uncharacterized protein LOC112466397, partial [Temnothorax curvispinosus]|uniref:Uncharacterized protein LOC112466397 n=1 Tax=Temnothorax curvispinosus TaxID=300111 RepID=A0A6J1R7P5_9HYME